MPPFFAALAKSQVLRYGLLGLVVTAAYYPSLFQVARADQMAYLYSTRDKGDLFSLTLGTCSWNREINGDIHFFRPVLFILLGLEQWAFTPCRPWAWQLVNLALHLAVVFLLYRWLQIWSGSPGWLPLVVAAFFGVQYASMELVAWHHLGGYLLFCVWLLGAFCILARGPQEASGARQAALVLLLLLAAFTMEIGSVLAVLVAGYIFAHRRRPLLFHREPGASAGSALAPGSRLTFHWLTLLGALAVPVVYTAVNLADQYARFGRILAGPVHEGCLSLASGLAGMFTAARLWFLSGFLPSHIDLGADSRMIITAVHPAFAPDLALQTGLALAVLLAFLALLATTLRRGAPGRRLGLAGVALLFGLAYTAILVFLRAGPRVLAPSLVSNTYYAYIFNLVALVFLSALVDFRSARFFRVVLGGALAVLAGISACRVHAQGWAEAAWSKPTLVMMEQIRRLHRADGGTADFTFCVAPDHPGETVVPYVGTAPDGHIITAAEVFFPRHYRRAHPKYFLWRRHRGFDIVSFRGRVFGIPNAVWASPRFALEDDPRCITGKTPGQVQRAIDRQRNRKSAHVARQDRKR